MYDFQTMIVRWQTAFGVVWVLLAIDAIAHSYWWHTPMAQVMGQLLVMTVLFALLVVGLEWLKHRYARSAFLLP
jgi:hypothetical protein